MFETFWKTGPAMLSMEDWPLYHPDEMRLIEVIRLAHNERSFLIETPGHVFDISEATETIGMFSLSVAFEWTSYLYLPDAKITVLNWEGVICDFWAEDKTATDEMLEILSSFKLEETKDSKARRT
jgi:hypothetical protein